MSSLTIKPNWHDEINQVDVTEPIIGGDGGNANLAARQLAESMLWLKLNMQALVPMGYIYHSHEASNPKPKFDKLLGIETHWRRITGKVMVGTNPADAFIKDVGAVIGQKGMTTPAGSVRPNAYPLQATNIFERYDPNITLTPTYTVYANKQTVGGGSSVEFTITGINTPNNPAINYIITEGILNETGAEITVPDSEVRGTAFLVDGSAVIPYDTVKDMPVDPARHVIFTAAAPVDDVVILPIVEDTVVATLSFTINTVEQSTKKGSMTYRTPVPVVTGVTESPLKLPEFDSSGRRYHTFEELESVLRELGGLPAITDGFRLHHIWVRLPDEYADSSLYTISLAAGSAGGRNNFNIEVIRDASYGGVFRANTPAGEQAHRNWVKLKSTINKNWDQSYLPQNVPITITVTRKV